MTTGDSFEPQLLALLHLCDSLFPSGGFAHSDGLEAATSSGQVATVNDLRDFIDASLDGNLGRTDGPAVWLAHQARSGDRWDDLRQLDEEVNALRPSSTARAASRAMGGRLLKTWLEIHEGKGTGQREEGRYCLPVAFGIVCGSIAIEARTAVTAFLYTRLAGMVSSAMRLMPIGQRDAHTLLASARRRVPSIVDAIADRAARGVRIGAFTPALDIAAMSQQYVHSRLFLS